MKKTLLFLFLLYVTTSVSAQDYLPFLKDGRKWEYVWKYVDSSNHFYPAECNITITVCGDTIVNGEPWKKLRYDFEKYTILNSELTYYIVANEKDGRLYGWDGEEESLKIDMNLNKGDIVKYPNAYLDYQGFTVLDKDTVTILGTKRRFLKIEDNNFGGDGYWIEGIGTTNSLCLNSVISFDHGQVCYIQKCYDNDKLIFSIDEFKPHGKPVGITSTTTDVHKEGKTYNINGTIANGKEKNKILIRDGKKFINR